MRRTELLQEIRKMRFEEAYNGWKERRLTQEEAARLLGVCERTFRRYIDRYEEEGLDGLIDKRLSQVSHRKAPVDEVLRLEALYKERYDGWSIKHFYSFYQREHGGTRSYTWVRNTLQKAGLVKKAPGRGKHRRKRERAPMRGMMVVKSQFCCKFASTGSVLLPVQWPMLATCAFFWSVGCRAAHHS